MQTITEWALVTSPADNLIDLRTVCRSNRNMSTNAISSTFPSDQLYLKPVTALSASEVSRTTFNSTIYTFSTIKSIVFSISSVSSSSWIMTDGCLRTRPTEWLVEVWRTFTNMLSIVKRSKQWLHLRPRNSALHSLFAQSSSSVYTLQV